MRRGATNIDELIRVLLPKAPLPAHLSPRDLLDDAVEPPPKVAEKVHALRALLKSGGRPESLLGTPFCSSADVAAHYIPLLSADTIESMHVVGTDSRNAVRLMRCVARGGSSACAVVPRDVLRAVVLNACMGLIVVHNHPSGDPTPSAADIALTARLAGGADVLGISFHDHIVIGGGKHVSFRDAGLLPPR